MTSDFFRIASDLGVCNSNRVAHRSWIARFGPPSAGKIFQKATLEPEPCFAVKLYWHAFQTGPPNHNIEQNEKNVPKKLFLLRFPSPHSSPSPTKSAASLQINFSVCALLYFKMLLLCIPFLHGCSGSCGQNQEAHASSWDCSNVCQVLQSLTADFFSIFRAQTLTPKIDNACISEKPWPVPARAAFAPR